MDHAAASPTDLIAGLLNPIDQLLARNAVWFMAVAALAALQLTLIATHQAWPDEYQALLIAKEASNQSELLAWLRYEGHPPLWYWFLRVLGSVVPLGWELPIAATLCALTVQSVILFASPFARAERVLLASSHYVLFEFLTISRGTSLGVALVTLAMIAWRSRWLWVIMTLLPMVDFLFGVISGAFLILKWREREVWWPGVALWLAGSAFAGWSVLPAPDMVSASDAMQDKAGIALLSESALGWFLKMGSLPLPFQGGVSPQWNTPVWPISGVAWLIMLWLCWRLTAGFAWHRLMIFGFFGFTLAFSLAVYPIGLRHLMLGSLLLIVLVWRQQIAKPLADPVWQGWLLVLAIVGLVSSGLSATRGFDSGGAVVAEIERRGLTDKRWVAIPEWRVPAVSGRSAIAFERLGKDCVFTFVRWDHAYSAIASKEAFTAALKADIARNGKGYLFSDIKFSGFDTRLLTPLATVPKGYDGVPYFLYIIGPEAPEKSRNLPFCHSTDQPQPR